MLEARDLCRNFPDGWLLDHAALTLHPGDRLGISGSSGAGKTLLLRALTLLDPVDSGAVLWQGEPIADVPAYRRQVAYVQQQPGLIEGDVEANLRVPFELKQHQERRFERDRIIDWLVRLHRDESFLRKSHADLSGGEAQIVALLRILQLDPTILLLDEPTAALDDKTARVVEEVLVGWCAEDRAFIWVSHDGDQLGRVTNRLLRMEKGKLEVARQWPAARENE